jgi:hypothetical protein
LLFPNLLYCFFIILLKLEMLKNIMFLTHNKCVICISFIDMLKHVRQFVLIHKNKNNVDPFTLFVRLNARPTCKHISQQKSLFSLSSNVACDVLDLSDQFGYFVRLKGIAFLITLDRYETLSLHVMVKNLKSFNKFLKIDDQKYVVKGLEKIS